MEEIKRQVTTARRRLILQQFLTVVPWTLFATLLLAVCAIGATKIWPVNVDPTIWTWSWIGGSFAAGVLIASVWTYFVRYDTLNAAIEIDRRFGLKERVSSALSLAPEELESESGQALVHDASRRVDCGHWRQCCIFRLVWGFGSSFIVRSPGAAISGAKLTIAKVGAAKSTFVSLGLWTAAGKK